MTIRKKQNKLDQRTKIIMIIVLIFVVILAFSYINLRQKSKKIAKEQQQVESQISFRSSASNLETALADAYYGATILYPEQFADVDVEAKTGEIFEMLLGSNPYQDLKDAGRQTVLCGWSLTAI